MSEWISVKNRLPEQGEDVLMAFWCEENEYNNMAVGFLVGTDEHMTMWAAYTDEAFYTDCDATPTHWMPLPEPPEEE